MTAKNLWANETQAREPDNYVKREFNLVTLLSSDCKFMVDGAQFDKTPDGRYVLKDDSPFCAMHWFEKRLIGDTDRKVVGEISPAEKQITIMRAQLDPDACRKARGTKSYNYDGNLGDALQELGNAGYVFNILDSFKDEQIATLNRDGKLVKAVTIKDILSFADQKTKFPAPYYRFFE
jgi:hypothetical protein